MIFTYLTYTYILIVPLNSRAALVIYLRFLSNALVLGNVCKYRHFQKLDSLATILFD